ncbi:MAG: transcriptional regulator [Rhodospirillales bacterium]|nr:transcriptional regulator [Rhodospirillales bacterium]
MEDINAPPIGPLIHRQRLSRGLTLVQLAALSGVSKSMLSQIERGQANPTFAVLWSLTRALKIELADLIEGGSLPSEETSIEVVSAAHTPQITSSDGSCTLRILSPPRLAGEVEWYEVEVTAAGSLDSTAHAPNAIEHFTALTAGFEVNSGNSTRSLKAGETARYRADLPHRITNISSKRAKGLMVVLYR